MRRPVLRGAAPLRQNAKQRETACLTAMVNPLVKTVPKRAAAMRALYEH